MSAKEALEKKLAAYVGVVQGPVEIAQDAVNEAMIRHWCEAMGDRNPVYLDAEAARRSVHGGIVAPPVMLQAWILGGLEMADTTAGPKNKQQELHKLLSEHPRVETDSARVRLVKLGSSSLDLEACAYALATDPQAYLKIQEELLLQIMDAIEGERGDGSISKPDAALRGTDTGTPTSRRA